MSSMLDIHRNANDADIMAHETATTEQIGTVVGTSTPTTIPLMEEGSGPSSTAHEKDMDTATLRGIDDRVDLEYAKEGTPAVGVEAATNVAAVPPVLPLIASNTVSPTSGNVNNPTDKNIRSGEEDTAIQVTTSSVSGMIVQTSLSNVNQPTASALPSNNNTSSNLRIPYKYDPEKITLRFLFANRDGLTVTVTCKPSDTVGEVKGALISVWPKGNVC
jgi:hypothetical protein